jgi:hypothetical protein
MNIIRYHFDFQRYSADPATDGRTGRGGVAEDGVVVAAKTGVTIDAITTKVHDIIE